MINLQPGGSAGAKQPRPTGSAAMLIPINFDLFDQPSRAVPLRAGKLTQRAVAVIFAFSAAGTIRFAFPDTIVHP